MANITKEQIQEMLKFDDYYLYEIDFDQFLPKKFYNYFSCNGSVNGFIVKNKQDFLDVEIYVEYNNRDGINILNPKDIQKFQKASDILLSLPYFSKIQYDYYELSAAINLCVPLDDAKIQKLLAPYYKNFLEEKEQDERREREMAERAANQENDTIEKALKILKERGNTITIQPKD